MSNESTCLLSSDAKRSVREAYREIIRYIYAHHLRAGDILPTHTQFQKELGLGNDTIGEAMAVMVSEGVLERQRRVGTTLRDLSRAVQMVWTIGLTQHEQSSFGFPGILEYHLRKRFVQHGCRDRTFYRPVPPRDRPHRLDDFHGLSEAVADRQIDAIITPEDFQTDEQILVFSLTPTKESRFGIRLDTNAFLHQACGVLALRGAKRMVWTRRESIGPYSRKREMEEREYLTLLNREGLSVNVLEYENFSIFGGRNIAEQCLGLSAADRPDGLIIMDDYVAMGLTDRLKEQSTYRPHIVCICNRQAPLLFSLPVIRFELDIEAMAVQTADMVMQQLVDPSTPQQVQNYHVQLRTENL